MAFHRERGSSPHILYQIGRQQQRPLVGRDHEYHILQQMLLETEQSTPEPSNENPMSTTLSWASPPRSSCVLLHGEPGIGKTRLAEEVGRAARERNWSVIWSSAYAQESSNTYRLWSVAIRNAIEQGLWQPSSEQLQTLYQPLTTLLPELADCPFPDLRPSTLPQEQERLRLWEAIFALLTAISKPRPLLIILDDLQWADGRSCELLAYLVRRLVDYPLLLVGTYRESELLSSHPLHPLLASLHREKVITTLPVPALTDEQIALLVSHLPADSMIKQIQHLAAGNPFFAEELAHVFSSEETSRNTDTGKPRKRALPGTIVAVIDQRLRRLSHQCQQFLSHAAVLGGTFTFSMIHLMECASNASVNEDALFSLIEEALKARVLTEEGLGSSISYRFWHPLLVSHLYDNLSALRRSQLHRQAANVICQVYAAREEEGAASIMHHLMHGGAPGPQIVHYAELAGNRAYALSAYPDAEQYYLCVLDHLPSLEASTNALPDAASYRASLFMRLGECMRFQGKFEEAYRAYEQTLQLRCQHLLPSSVDSQEEIQVQALLWCEMGSTWYSRSRHEQARQCYQRSEQLLLDAKIIAGPAWAYLRLQQSYINWREGAYEEARRTAYEALRLFGAAHETARAQHLSSTTNNARLTRIERLLRGDPVNLGRTHMLLGVIAVADSQCSASLMHLNRALALYEQHGLQRDIAIVCCNLGEAHRCKAEYSQARAFFTRSLAIAERIGEISLTFYAFSNLGLLDLHCGDLSEAEGKLRRGITLAERFDDPVSKSMAYSYLASALQEQGELPEARAALHQALMLGRVMHVSPCLSLTLVTLGRIRIIQALTSTLPFERTRLLKRARSTLQRVLTIGSLEAETRVEGHLWLAHASLLLDQREAAYQLALQALGEAHQFELAGLIPSALRLLGDILLAQNQSSQALPYFRQAMQEFQTCGMRLQYARTLLRYGIILLQHPSSTEQERQQGLNSLHEAQSLFLTCQSLLDLHIVENMLQEMSSTSRMPVHYYL